MKIKIAVSLMALYCCLSCSSTQNSIRNIASASEEINKSFSKGSVFTAKELINTNWKFISSTFLEISDDDYDGNMIPFDSKDYPFISPKNLSFLTITKNSQSEETPLTFSISYNKNYSDKDSEVKYPIQFHEKVTSKTTHGIYDEGIKHIAGELVWTRQYLVECKAEGTKKEKMLCKISFLTPDKSKYVEIIMHEYKKQK